MIYSDNMIILVILYIIKKKFPDLSTITVFNEDNREIGKIKKAF